MKPRMFIGSSVEGLPVATALQECLDRDVIATQWTDNIFEPSGSTLESLLDKSKKFDLALLVLMPDDIAVIRKRKLAVARDNVIFELGLFVSRLSRRHCFFLIPRDRTDFHLPSDLAGITPLTFDADRGDDNLKAAVNPASSQIRRAIADLSDRSLAGAWRESWSIDGVPGAWESDVEVSHFGNMFKARFETRTESYRIEGVVEREMFVTGSWWDKRKGVSYFGAFQLNIRPDAKSMIGRWVGFGHDNAINSGEWRWTRLAKTPRSP